MDGFGDGTHMSGIGCATFGTFLAAAASGLPYTANLVGWWDPSVAASVTLSSGKVSQLNDLSGNAWHMLQATATNQPTYTTGMQNGLNGLTFSGAQHLTPSSTKAYGALTLFVVVRFTNNASTGIAFGYSGYSADFQNRNANGATPNLTWAMQAKPGPSGTAVLKTNNASLDTAWHVAHVLRDTTTFDPRHDAGSAWVQPTGFSNGTLSAVTNPGKLWLGTRNDLAVPYTGEMGEVLLYNAVLGSTDRTNVLNYLKAKWGTI